MSHDIALFYQTIIDTLSFPPHRVFKVREIWQEISAMMYMIYNVVLLWLVRHSPWQHQQERVRKGL